VNLNFKNMITDYKTAVQNIRTILKDYIVKSNLKSLVLGVSGGIDSAFAAVLAYPVCKELNIKLICRSLTILTNKAEEINRAKLIGESFGSDFKEIDLSEVFLVMQKSLVEDFDKQDLSSYDFKIRLGNVKARTRMIYLYDLAGKNKGMVLSTDNYTELLLGFWTLHGDVGDYGMFQNLWKTEVYAISEYLAENECNQKQKESLIACINAVPTDGLGITNSDLDQIKAGTYEEVDQILIKMLNNNLGDLHNHPVVQRNRNSEYKRNNPYNIPRELITIE
jgi:NAD+ synthetase